MAASINDLTTQGSNGTRPSPTTLTAIKNIGDSSITCSALTGWATATAVHFIIYNTDTSGNKVAGTQTDWKGIVSGSTITNLTLRAGTDQQYLVGAVVEAAPTAAWADDTYSAITQDHDSRGRHSKLTDTNGVKIVGLNAVSSAVNNLAFSNATANNKPLLKAEGSDTDISPSFRGKGSGLADVDGMAPKQWADNAYDFIESGCYWSGDAYGSTRNASMTSGFAWIGGKRLSVAAVTARTFTASKDTYIDLSDNGDGTAAITYTEATNNAASPALSAGAMRIAIIVTGAGNIAGAGSVNQGEHDKVLPIASSVAYSVTDSLGNLIGNRTPNPIVIGFKQITSNSTTSSTSAVALTGLSVPVIAPANRRVRIRVAGYNMYNDTVSHATVVDIWDGGVGSGTRIAAAAVVSGAANVYAPLTVQGFSYSTTATLKTYNAAFHVGAGSTATVEAGSDFPLQMTVELV